MKRRNLRQSAALTLTLLILALSAFGLAGTASAERDDDDDDGRRRQLSTRLVGAEEVPGPGDPDGRGRAKITLKPNQSTICYKLNVSKIAPATGAHIHLGDRGTAGPVVFNMEPPTDGSSRGCAPADPVLIQNLMRDPDAYYVNIHNAEFPDGALRGQLGGGGGDDDD